MIIVAPFSNGLIRDWPAAHFAKLIALLLPKLDPDQLVRVIGSPEQRRRAFEIVRDLPADKVINDCGTMPWADVLKLLRVADCVIGNNSGIAHLAGMYGVPTVCIFGGSHQRTEWYPLGPKVTVLSRVIGCSPCHLDHRPNCVYDKACLTEIQPEEVADVVLASLSGNQQQAQVLTEVA
jgi:ADP-heptose:LPS heptosyltransferase